MSIKRVSGASLLVSLFIILFYILTQESGLLDALIIFSSAIAITGVILFAVILIVSDT